MKKKYDTLYTRNTNGTINLWYCEQNDNEYTTTYGQLEGKSQTSLPIFCEIKNKGKVNESDPVKQCETEILALYKKKLKQNHFYDINDIDKGFLEPQLAKPNKEFIDDVDWSAGQIVDDKLNGFACIVIAKDARSRKNEQYHSIPHILRDLEPFFAANPTAYIQGELYNPKYINQLNRIAELIAVTRKPKDITPELLIESEKIVELHLYDGYGFNGLTQQSKGKERREELLKVFQKFNFKYVFPIKFDVCYSMEEMVIAADKYIKGEKGEGKIIRDPNAPYFHKRTRALLKWKKSESAEFKVISVESGSGNWEGCAKFVWCELPNGTRDKKFKANIKGEREHLRELYKNRDYFPGKYITVELQEYSEYNVPQLPYTDMVIRSEIEG